MDWNDNGYNSDDRNGNTRSYSEAFAAAPAQADQQQHQHQHQHQHQQQQQDETASLARAIEASLQDELTRKSRRLAQEMMQQSQQLEESNRRAQQEMTQRTLLEESDKQLARTIQESQQQYESHEDMKEAMDKTLAESQNLRSEERHEGSWHCIDCTFTNKPYRPNCEACGSKALPHVLVFAEMPPGIRFGLEIEIFLPRGKEDGFTFDSLAKQLTTLGPPKVQFRGYTHETTDYWKIVPDSSVAGDDQNDRDLSFELVSPVLQGEAGLVSLRTIMENIRRLGIATNRTCSFHVHVDAESGSELGSLNSLKRVAQCFVSCENAFDLLVSLTWDRVEDSRRGNRNEFCRSNRLAFGEKSNRQRWDDLSSVRSRYDLVERINPDNDRYHKLNMTNIVKASRPSTCEFRHHGGVEDIREAEAWVRLIVLFCRNSASNKPLANSCLLPENSSPRTELQALFNLVDCAGLEQFFTVERRLFANHRLHNRWQCGLCSRNFDPSRSLAQHTAASGH